MLPSRREQGEVHDGTALHVTSPVPRSTIAEDPNLLIEDMFVLGATKCDSEPP